MVNAQLGDYRAWMSNNKGNEPMLIKNILPMDAEEYALLAGRTGIGKSKLATHLGFCLATGTPFMGFPTQRCMVGYLAMEGGKSNWRDRLDKTAQCYPDTNGNFKFDKRDSLELSKGYDFYLDFFAGCRVVILDNLKQVTAGKWHLPDYATEWTKTFRSLLKELGANGVVTHHIKKPNDAIIDPGDVYSLKGATEYVDASATVLLLERKRQGRSFDGRGFGFVEKNAVILYFAKAGRALDDLEPIELRNNYDKAGFDTVDNPNQELQVELRR